MAITTPLITKSDFTPYFNFSYYQEETPLNQAILNTQESTLKPILDNTTTSGGTTIYSELQTYVENNKTPTDSDLDALLVKVTPFLVFKTLSDFIPFANTYATNMGFRILKEENSEAVNSEQLAAMASTANSKSKEYEKALRDFLCNNATTYGWNDNAATKFNIAVKIGKIGYKNIRRGDRTR